MGLDRDRPLDGPWIALRAFPERELFDLGDRARALLGLLPEDLLLESGQLMLGLDAAGLFLLGGGLCSLLRRMRGQRGLDQLFSIRCFESLARHGRLVSELSAPRGAR